MEKSLFIEFIEKYFQGVVGKITEKINGKKTEEQLLHKTMLTEEYSPDLTWGSTELNTSIVAADVVSMDSSLPLKKRDKVATASGRIPKIGVKFRKGEKLISDINIMKARGADEQEIANKIFDDTGKSIKAVDVRKEIMFQEALSTGETLVNDEDNIGTGIRVKFGYKAENTFHALKATWGNTGATPQDDVQQLFDKAQEDGNNIGLVMMSKKYFNYFRNSEQGKLLAANYNKQVIIDKALLPVPSRQSFLDILSDEYGATFRIVDSAFKIEKPDGSNGKIRPWAEGNIVGLPEENVGRLVYGTLAEETNPVNSVSYQKSGSHILVAKYSKTDPLEEFTTAQALVLPVIDGVDGIYILHADATGSFVIDPSSLSFTKDADSTGKKFTVHADSSVTAKSNQSWCTVSMKGNVGTVKVTANTDAERSATITVTDETEGTATVTVTQAAGNV